MAQILGNSSSNSTNNSTGLNIQSDTPQGQISKPEILSGKYASNTNGSETQANIIDNTQTSSNASNNSDETYSKNIKGNSGVSATAQKMVEQFRDNVITIDKDIIEELDILFMQIF